MTDWQATARALARRRTAELYPRRLVRELASIVGDGPRFADEDARRCFPRHLWGWAAETLLYARYPARPPPKAAGRPLGHFCGTVRGALREWAEMPDDLRRWIALHAPRQLPPTGDPAADSDRVEKATDDALARIWGHLAYVVQAADAARVMQGARTQRPRREKHALEGLARLWVDATGKKPTRTNERFGRSGAFVDFAYKAMLPIFPEMGRIDGLIEEATKPKKPGPERADPEKR
jgi:hypothetical protein